ncbi:EscU/YscU/HrcU family type III secretion system export apparatus switch protein [Primorskyibacter sp. S87]|uniref:EscU/YscU/HrcU family type III secretion system export apparatus switch protein n=1 Tax=Primorskyibacter sp. S87 TaxID=3415126 RepID=UPI003C79BDCB
MSGSDDTDKSFDPTPQKLLKARKKGEIARSADLSVAAAYAGLLLAAAVFGAESIRQLGTALATILDQADALSSLAFEGQPQALAGGIAITILQGSAPWFGLPAVLVILSILAQRAFVVVPSRVKPKVSRISPVSNAKNKFGRSGLFEFSKSFFKLILYSVCLGLFLRAKLPEILIATDTQSGLVVVLLGQLFIQFLSLVLLVSLGLGVVDAVWQHHEHIRKNRMSRKEITDETKDAEGDPHMKQHRRQKGQEIAMKQMMGEVPNADVVIVNPTHFAVALYWDRLPGSAPKCVAKGVDEIAATIRETAQAAGIPIHSDPPTARSIHATTDLGSEISEEHYQAVAAAIRFADQMRLKAKGKVT